MKAVKKSKSKIFYDNNPISKKKKGDYDSEYQKDRVKYREELNAANRKLGKKGDGKDVSHTTGGKLNQKRLKAIQRKAEKAFESGDIEKAKELSAKADKIAKRQKKWKDGIERFDEQQKKAAAKNKKANYGSMDDLAAQIRAEQDRITSASRGGAPSTAQTPSKSKPSVSVTKKNR